MLVWRNGRRDGLKIRWGQLHVGSTPTSGTKRKTALLFLNLAHARFLKRFRLFFAFRDQTQLTSKNASIFGEKEQTSDGVSMFASANKRQERSLRRRRDLIRCFCSRIIFVCTFIFSLFVFLFSSHRIIFEIKNKKEERKVAVNFIIGSRTGA